MSASPTICVWSEPPPQETGSADPTLLATGSTVHLAYNAHNPDFPGWSSGASPDHPGFKEKVAVIRFYMVRVHRFGYPNSEALAGHPLYECGLQMYAFQTVEPSPWVADLCRQNQVHPRHTPALWADLTHWIVTFEDDMLEVVGKSAVIVGVYDATTPAGVLRKASAS